MYSAALYRGLPITWVSRLHPLPTFSNYVFPFPHNQMVPDLLCILQDEETRELILLIVQNKISENRDLAACLRFY